MAIALTYYYDKECKKRYPVNEKGEAVIDWGITIPGQVKTKELYARNESRDRAVLRQPYTMDEDLKIKDYPKNLMGHDGSGGYAIGKVILEFSPNKDRIDALHASWGFDIILG